MVAPAASGLVSRPAKTGHSAPEGSRFDGERDGRRLGQRHGECRPRRDLRATAGALACRLERLGGQPGEIVPGDPTRGLVLGDGSIGRLDRGADCRIPRARRKTKRQ